MPLLTKRAKDVRLSWARDHLRYNWKKVIFSDETTLQMFSNTIRAWSHDAQPIAPMVISAQAFRSSICRLISIGVARGIETLVFLFFSLHMSPNGSAAFSVQAIVRVTLE